MKNKEQIKKGCGKRTDKDPYDPIIKCGEGNSLCKVCQAKLEGYEQAEKEKQEQVKELKEDIDKGFYASLKGIAKGEVKEMIDKYLITDNPAYTNSDDKGVETANRELEVNKMQNEIMGDIDKSYEENKSQGDENGN